MSILFHSVIGAQRESVREPHNPKSILVRFLDTDAKGGATTFDVPVNVPTALEMIQGLSRQIGTVCQRADIRDALGRTKPGSVT